MRLARTRWFLMMGLSTLIVLASSRYLTLDPSTYFEDQMSVYIKREGVLISHVAAAMIALLVGPWQFVGRIRRGHTWLHRALGTVYVSACFVGGVAGVMLATTAHGGWISTLGFGTLGLLWLGTTALGVRAALGQRYPEHRRWMIRSFALCFAAVTLRVYLGIFGALDAAGLTLGVTFTTAYSIIAWLCWAPNLAVAVAITRPRRDLLRAEGLEDRVG